MWTSPLGRWASLTACAASLTFASGAFAGQMMPGSVPGEKATLIPNTATFSCETRPFDLSKGLFCYTPNTIRKAYGIDTLLSKGFTGKGRTIVIIDAFGSPSIQSDLALFDTAFGIPAPPSLKIITMPGTPAYDPTNADMVGWTGEIALDTQWAHAVAPGANIVFIAAKSDNDERVERAPRETFQARWNISTCLAFKVLWCHDLHRRILPSSFAVCPFTPDSDRKTDIPKPSLRARNRHS